MSNEISNTLKQQMFANESNDPFLLLVTMNHTSFGELRFVNNNEDIISNGLTYSAFPMNITLPADDGESDRNVQIVFDNVTLELIGEIRKVTDRIDATVKMVLASNPDVVEIEYTELKMGDISYDLNSITAALQLDDFLNTEISSEKYNPSNFPGIFS